MLNYQCKGTGNKTIIFIHGNSSSLEIWNDVVNNNLLSEYTLISLDLPGHGKSFKSTEPEKDYSLKGMAVHVKALIKQLNLKDHTVVGNSLGCNIIGEATDGLQNCKGIMFTGSSAIGKNLTVADIMKPNPNAAALFTPEPTDEQIDLLIGDIAYSLTAQQKEFIKQDIKNTDPQVRVQIATAVGKQEYSDELTAIETTKLPVAVVFGEEDKLCMTDYLDKVPFPKWKNKSILIPNSGHFSQLDQPQALAVLIKEFAQECL
ncbi:MAG: alpha/beta fold hydrolase [Bacteroidia bacterium]